MVRLTASCLWMIMLSIGSVCAVSASEESLPHGFSLNFHPALARVGPVENRNFAATPVRTKLLQPVTNGEPIVYEYKPQGTNGEPIVFEYKPQGTNGEPIVFEYKPQGTNGEPIVFEYKPQGTNGEPIVFEYKPQGTNGEPIVFEYKPQGTNGEPIVFEYKPQGTNGEPIVFEYRGTPVLQQNAKLPVNPAQLRFTSELQKTGVSPGAISALNTAIFRPTFNSTSGPSTRGASPGLPKAGLPSGNPVGAGITGAPSFPAGTTIMTNISGHAAGFTAPITPSGFTMPVTTSGFTIPVNTTGSFTQSSQSFAGTSGGTQVVPSTSFGGGSGFSTFKPTGSPSFTTMPGFSKY